MPFPMCKMCTALVTDHVDHDHFSDVVNGFIGNPPSSFIVPCISRQRTNLTKCDTEDSQDRVECHRDETTEQSKQECDNNLATNLKSETLGVEDFEILKMVGEGSYGKVYQVRKKNTSEIYAMKVIEDNHSKNESDILMKVDHPSIIKLRSSFRTNNTLYLVMDFIDGGNMFRHIFHHGLYLEDQARIYAADIVSAVCHIHARGIMHRDIKPENILLDFDDHAVLSDFGAAEILDEKNNTLSYFVYGTLHYMAPEMVTKKGHDKAVDWWSVGVLLYQMLTGKLPFSGNQQECRKEILSKKIKLPGFLSSEAHSILKGLLTRDVCKRLGCGELGGEEVKRHKWFKGIDWKNLGAAREIKPSFLPEVAGGEDCSEEFECRRSSHISNISLVVSPKASLVRDS